MSVTGLEDSEYLDKVEGFKAKKQAGSVTITCETDRVYTPAGGPAEPVVVAEDGGRKKLFSVVRDNLADVVVWNPWSDKAEGIADFAPKDGWRRMLCVEPGAVRGWQTLEPKDALEGAQTIYAL